MTGAGRPSGGLLTHLLVLAVRFYQQVLSHLLPSMCRFEPSCSRYSVEALQTHGARRGSGLTLRRLLRCRPGGPSGYDPVPPRKETPSPREKT